MTLVDINTNIHVSIKKCNQPNFNSIYWTVIGEAKLEDENIVFYSYTKRNKYFYFKFKESCYLGDILNIPYLINKTTLLKYNEYIGLNKSTNINSLDSLSFETAKIGMIVELIDNPNKYGIIVNISKNIITVCFKGKVIVKCNPNTLKKSNLSFETVGSFKNSDDLIGVGTAGYLITQEGLIPSIVAYLYNYNFYYVYPVGDYIGIGCIRHKLRYEQLKLFLKANL